MVKEAVEAGADIIMLDNMDTDTHERSNPNDWRTEQRQNVPVM